MGCSLRLLGVGVLSVASLAACSADCEEESVAGSGGSAGKVFPCDEQGIRDAIALGGGPHTFACDGTAQPVMTEAPITIDKDVVLDGEGILTISHSVENATLSTVAGVTTELSGLGVTRTAQGSCEPTCVAIANAGTLALIDVTVTADGDNRLAITNFGALTATNTTVSGGVENLGGVELTNSTLSAAGLRNSGGAVTLTHCTVSGSLDNTATAGGDVGRLSATATVVDGECSAAVDSDGYNIESSGDTCGFDLASDQANVTAEDLNLDSLADNGGPTMTRALLTDSVAIDVIPEEDCEVATDQRGEPRPSDTMCDVGAFEVQP